MSRPKRLAAAAAVLTLCGCAGPGSRGPTDLDDAFGRFRQTFERGEVAPLDGLFPAGWALVAFSGETRRSITGAELRRQLTRLFRNRAPLSYREQPGSILGSESGDFVFFTAEWTSLAIGTDRLLVERFRIGLERVGEPGPPERGPVWQIREFTAWTR